MARVTSSPPSTSWWLPRVTRQSLLPLFPTASRFSWPIPMSLAEKVKTALDETRLLILGAQVLFGFQLNGVFQEAFAELAWSTRLLPCMGQFLMVLALALLIAPSMQHRIVEGGDDSNRIHRAT